MLRFTYFAFAVAIFGIQPITQQAVGQAPTISDQVRVDCVTPGNCGEPYRACEFSVASHPTNSLVAVSAWFYRNNQAGTIQQVRTGYTTNGGASWTYSNGPVPGLPAGSSQGDPMACADPITGEMWVGGFWQGTGSTSGAWISRWNGSGFDSAVTIAANVPSFPDHPQMVAGPRISNTAVSRMYVTYLESAGVHRLIWSDSPSVAGSWSAPLTISTNPIITGLVPRVGPDGRLYIIGWEELAFGIWMVQANEEDGTGAPKLKPPALVATRLDTWDYGDCARIPGRFRAPAWPTLAVDPVKGTLYVAYFDTTRTLCPFPDPVPSQCKYDVDVYLTKSTNYGDTWTVPKVINAPDGVPYDQFFPWIGVDSLSRVHAIFYDTNVGIPHDDVTELDARLRVRYTYSLDEGATWPTSHESTISPKYGSAPAYFSDGNGGFPINFIGDYNGLAVTAPRVYPGYMGTLGQSGVLPQHAYSNTIVWP